MRRLLWTLPIAAVLLPAQIRISTGNLVATLDPSVGYGFSELRDLHSGRNFLSSTIRLPIYRITLSAADGSAFDIDSSTASAVTARQNGDMVTLTFHHLVQSLAVTCTVHPDARASRLLWKIAIHNTGRFGVRSLFYPQWPAALQLSAAGNRLLYPFLDGQEFIDPGSHIPEAREYRTTYPGQAALQLLAYHDGQSGLLQMTQDGEGWVKHFRVARIAGALDLSVEHNPDERVGQDIDLPYETVLQTFRGDWRSAADIYREWAEKQKWAKQKIVERKPPAYLAAGLPIVTYEIRGDAYSAEWSMYFPPSNRLINPDFHPERIPELTKRYSDFFGSKVITNPFGWEHIAPWIAGPYFPPVGGEELWGRMAAALRVQGDPLFMLLSGMRWGVRMDNAGYNDRERFLQETAPTAAAYDSKGKPMEEQPPWADSIALCVGTPFTRKHLVDAFMGCVKRGASMVQYDQNHGGASPVCYNRQHSHPAGYGHWIVEDTEELFREIRSQGKRIDPSFAFSVEEPCEYFLPYWDSYMGRPYEFFGTGLDPTTRRAAVPLFIYVYHQYLMGYGGSNEIDVSHPYAEVIKVARKFVNGTLLNIDIGKPAFRLDTVPFPTAELQLARSASRALRTYGNHYLLLGRMLPDPVMDDMKTENIPMWRDATSTVRLENLPAATVPLVLFSTWQADGKVAYVFANWQTNAQVVTFQPQSYGLQNALYDLVVHDDSGERTIQSSRSLPAQVQWTVPPLSVGLVEQSGR